MSEHEPDGTTAPPLLERPPDIEVPKEAPFRHDALKREGVAANLSALVRTLSGPFVIGLDAPWGAGKSTFIRMWRACLEKEGHVCVMFNAWEADFTEDPLLAFVSALDEQLPDSGIRKAKQTVVDLGATILRRAVPAAIQIGTAGILSRNELEGLVDLTRKDADDLARWVSETAETRLKAHRMERSAVADFRKALQEVSRTVRESDHAGPVVVFVDELDRCRPDFAVALLERIKHLFNVDGIVFVLSMDMGQLAHSVGAAYGPGFDSDGYLRRFVDLRYVLPEPDRRGFSEAVMKRLRLSEVLEQSQVDFLAGGFGLLAEDFALSLRASEQVLAEAAVLLRVAPKSVTERLGELLVFFVLLRAVNRRLLTEFLAGRAGAEELIDLVKQTGSRVFANTRFGAWLEAELLLVSGRDGEVQAWIDDHKTVAGTDEEQTYRVEVSEAISAIRQGSTWFRQRLTEKLAGYLTFSSGVQFPDAGQS